MLDDIDDCRERLEYQLFEQLLVLLPDIRMAIEEGTLDSQRILQIGNSVGLSPACMKFIVIQYSDRSKLARLAPAATMSRLLRLLSSIGSPQTEPKDWFLIFQGTT